MSFLHLGLIFILVHEISAKKRKKFMNKVLLRKFAKTVLSFPLLFRPLYSRSRALPVSILKGCCAVAAASLSPSRELLQHAKGGFLKSSPLKLSDYLVFMFQFEKDPYSCAHPVPGFFKVI